jgi:hypothetical protein
MLVFLLLNRYSLSLGKKNLHFHHSRFCHLYYGAEKEYSWLNQDWVGFVDSIWSMTRSITPQ